MRKVFVLLVCFLLCSFGSASAVTLSLNPSNVTVNVGDTFDITLYAQLSDNAVQPGAISVWDVDVIYDSSQMSFLGHTLGVDLLPSVDLSWGDLGGGVIDLAELSFALPDELNAIQPGEFLLALLNFECLSPGNSVIELLVDYVGDENGDPLDVQIGVPVEVNQVPEPSTWILMCSSLIGLGLFSKKFRK